jgi:unsaturated rhamnogalacturonyl hydrolase
MRIPESMQRMGLRWFLRGLVFVCGVVVLHGQQLSPNGIPTAPYIDATVQADIDIDVSRHLGDTVADPGPRAQLSTATTAPSVHAAMKKVADWQLARSVPYMDRNWAWSVLYAGFMAASRELNDSRYSDAMQAIAERYRWELGAEAPDRLGWPDSNDQMMGQTYLELYSLKPDPARILPTRKALDTLFDAKLPPVPDGQFNYTWWWIDSLFMAPGTLAHMGAVTHDNRYFSYLSEHWWEISGGLYDHNYHLFYQQKAKMDKRDAAGKPIFWSRGNGWVMGGFARTLEYLPKTDPARPKLEAQFREMAAEFASIQDPVTGLWHVDLLDAHDYPQPEVSGSALVVLGMAWGVNHGVLDRKKYIPVVTKAWSGLVHEIYADGRLGNIQQTDMQPNRYLPGSSFNYGVGGFLLAAEQVAHLNDPVQR